MLAPGCWLLVLLLPLSAHAWIDASFPFRRAIDVSWDAEHAAGDELATVDFYTDGHARTDGGDLRVTTADDRPLPARVLTAGPGDRVRLAFALLKGVRRYYVYFGNPNPPAPRPGIGELKPTAGLLMEERPWSGGGGGPVDSAEHLQAAWAKAEQTQPVLGRLLLDRAALGVNPFGEQQQTIARFDGIFRASADGPYQFAMAADDRGALFLDDKPVLFANAAPADTRINATVTLTKGPHALQLYHVNLAGDLRLVVMCNPVAGGYAILDRPVLAPVYRGSTGGLEELRKTLTADFAVEQEAECFFAGRYAQRYRFTALPPKNVAAGKISYEWDFGDGQSSTSPNVQHLYLVDGIYPVRLTARLGGNSDVQTNRIAVSRDWEHVDKPTEDPIPVQARMLDGYDLSKLPPAALTRAGWLELRAEKLTEAMAICKRVAGETKHPDVAGALNLLREASSAAVAKGQDDAALTLWQTVPPESDLQPSASVQLAELLLWRQADYAGAVKLLAPLTGKGDARVKRLYAQALLLSGKPAEAEKILRALPTNDGGGHAAAIGGAEARTVEYYVTQGDAEAGEAAWEQWQARLPADFLEGYSVLLKSRLLEIAKAPASAAALAEAFALAEPSSSYSPQLLDRASRLLATSDAARSVALRKLLKERYPEDPLSQ